MTVARYEPNPRFEAELLRSVEIVPILEDFTGRTAARARDLAAERSKTIAAGIDSEVAMTAQGYRGRVNAFDFKSGWAEFGTSRFPQVRMLGRALEEIVGRVEVDSR